jgi:hypothetical protein
MRQHDTRSPTHYSVTTFGWTIAAFQENGFLYENPDPKRAYECLHANAIEHGMCFSPNGGTTWMTSLWFKSPYHSA